MLKTAEEYLKEHHYVRQDPEVDIDGLVKIINQARSDAIKECAESVSITCYNYDSQGNKINIQGMGFEISITGDANSDYYAADKQSILNLLNEVK